jgi:hypothetical protein
MHNKSTRTTKCLKKYKKTRKRRKQSEENEENLSNANVNKFNENFKLKKKGFTILIFNLRLRLQKLGVAFKVVIIH